MQAPVYFYVHFYVHSLTIPSPYLSHSQVIRIYNVNNDNNDAHTYACAHSHTCAHTIPMSSTTFTGLVTTVIYCEATHVCYIEDAREVTHVILMLLVEQG